MLQWHVLSVHDGDTELLGVVGFVAAGMGDTPDIQAVAPTKELMQWSGFNGFFLFSLPSCSNFRMLDIFQINIKRWFEKQTLSPPSKGKGNMHLNENPVFHYKLVLVK